MRGALRTRHPLGQYPCIFGGLQELPPKARQVALVSVAVDIP